MNEYNLRVHLSNRRVNENKKYDFKFAKNSQLYILSKWLGDEDTKTRDNVSYGNKIMYDIDYSYYGEKGDKI